MRSCSLSGVSSHHGALFNFIALLPASVMVPQPLDTVNHASRR
jgi:hypothetical protein